MTTVLRGRDKAYRFPVPIQKERIPLNKTPTGNRKKKKDARLQKPIKRSVEGKRDQITSARAPAGKEKISYGDGQKQRDAKKKVL